MSEKTTYEELSKRLQECEEVAEEALKRSEKKYRRLVESLERDYIIYSHDADGNFSYLSPSIVNVLGYSQDDFMGHYTEYMTDNPMNKDVEEHTNAALRGEKQEPYEAEFWHKDGRRVRLRATEIPVVDSTGNVVGIEGIVQDITELKQKEDELLESNLTLKKTTQELEIALSKIKVLTGILPTCQHCKRIRPPDRSDDDPRSWTPIETYVRQHSDAQFSHGICPDCMQKLYSEVESRESAPENDQDVEPRHATDG